MGLGMEFGVGVVADLDAGGVLVFVRSCWKIREGG